MLFKDYIFHFKALINFGISIFSILLVTSAASFLVRLIARKKGSWLRPIHLKNNEIVSVEMMVTVLSNVIRALKWILVLSILYVSIPFVLQELPSTHDYAVTLMDSVQTNFWKVADGFLNFIPNMFFIAFVIFITRGLIKFFKFIFTKIEKKN